MARELAGPGFGEQLRRERERRGVAVETICAVTKVPVRHIVSLEAGALGDLPGGVFRRGFLRSYLDALGIEEGTWMERLEECCRGSGVRERAWTAFAENVKNSRTRPRRRSRPRLVWGMLVAVPFLVVGLGIGALVVTHRNQVSHPHPWKSMKSWVDKLTSR
jgi:cytoskeletal protein RodZ